MIAVRIKHLTSHLVFQIALIILLLFALFRMFSPLLFQYLISYSKLIVGMAYEDTDRYKKADHLAWQSEYKLHEMEMMFNQEWCESQHVNKKTAWLTAMMNDNYAVGAVYLGYVLKKLSCHHKMIALVSNTVTEISQEALRKVGYEVKLVEPLDCNWMDRRKGWKPRNLGLPGTHMRFHAWNYTQYEKIVYLDPDIMPLTNIDELFTLKGELAAGYCARPGIIDPCFNAGLLMFEPSSKSYQEIMDMWSHLSKGKNCPNDQVLLWHYYADRGRWVPLPYAYNVRRYLYHPLKVYHFACCLTKKPWKVDNKPTRKETIDFKGPLTEPMHLVILWWRSFFEALDEYQLHDWYNKIKDTI